MNILPGAEALESTVAAPSSYLSHQMWCKGHQGIYALQAFHT